MTRLAVNSRHLFFIILHLFYIQRIMQTKNFLVDLFLCLWAWQVVQTFNCSNTPGLHWRHKQICGNKCSCVLYMCTPVLMCTLMHNCNDDKESILLNSSWRLAGYKTCLMFLMNSYELLDPFFTDFTLQLLVLPTPTDNYPKQPG